ncbi:hypothetical protein VNO77_02984 [Canavalia gladiata]|uniref:Uncharacterized protein n=1 Tax=Canavalia gladiata TaxID=3824 RepID=A0AAN9RBT1_CANGL
MVISCSTAVECGRFGNTTQRAQFLTRLLILETIKPIDAPPWLEIYHNGKVGHNQIISGFGSSTSSQFRSKGSPKSFRAINSHTYEKEIENEGMTWLLLSYIPSSRGIQYYETIVDDIPNSLQGSLKVGNINYEKEVSFSKEFGLYPHRAPRRFVFSYKEDEKGSLVEYSGNLAVKDSKAFCQEHLPRF